jgi:hypothetical protein
MATAKTPLSARSRLWRSGSSPSVSSMGKPGLTFSPFPSRRRDGLAKHPRSEGAGGAAADRLDIKRQSGSHRTLSRDGWPDLVFAFHDGEEIGPCMLARIAKRTGLSAGRSTPLRYADVA